MPPTDLMPAFNRCHPQHSIGATHRLDATRFRHLLQDQHSNRCHPPISCQHSNCCQSVPPSLSSTGGTPVPREHSIGATHRLDATRFRYLLQDSSLTIPIGATHRSHASIPIAVNRCHHRYPARAGRPASAPLTASKREGLSPFMGLIWTH